MTDAAHLTMTLPGNVKFFRPVRLAVGGLAAVVGFDIAAIDDLRIGVDELCAALAEVGDGAELVLSFDVEPQRGLRIEGRTRRAVEHLESDRLHFSRQILEVVADRYSLAIEGDEVCFWLARAIPDADASAPLATLDP